MIKLVENERKQLLNGLSDAIKECQLRFGGKRELATDLDSRVCVLCLKLEAIFMHGLKKKPMLLNSSSSQSSSSSSSSILAGTLQFNSIITLKNKTGNLISQLFDENKPTNSFLQSNSQNNTQIDDISFWPFVKNLMNKFDIERYELLNNIKTNTGRQRAWLRSCLNEHCLERFTIAVLANETLTNQFYEEWSFLLDKSYNSTLPMLISGLESILFAINIDNPSLNIPSKLVLANNIKAINETINNENNNNTTTTNDDNLVETIAIKIKKPLNNSLVQNTNLNRKIRKNNVVVLDSEIDSTKTSDETTSANASPEKKPIRSRSVFSTSSYSSLTSSMPNRSSILVNPINYSPKKDLEQNDLDNDLMKKNEEEKKKENSDLNLFEIGSLRNEVFDKIIIEKSTSTTSLKDHSKSNEINDISTDSSTEADIYKIYDSSANLIPVNAAINNGSTTVDNISINSYLSEHSNEINFNSYKANNTNLNVNGSFNNNISPSSLTSSKSMEMNQNIPQISNSSQRTSTIIASEYDGLNLKEMREFVLTMIQRKDDLENKYKKLDENYKEELQKSKDLNDKLIQIEQDTKIKTDNYENKIQNLESENKLLKDQLKKYVSAVQMIRSNTVCSTDTSANGNQIVSTIPAVNPNLQRDYSFEAEQYEKKLIQVAEMHGELMEFNSRLHKILNFKTLQIEKLKQELIELRGPLPNEMMLNETYDESFSMMSDIESLTNLNGPLINIWIPSAFLRTNKSDSHHVYQIYVRIRDEEWNIYRRFSHFYNLNVRIKEKFPALKTIKFPKKKAIGNKDSKFVENRRKMLQDYLRQIVTTVSQVDRDLSLKPCRETLSKTIPFLSDQHFFTASNNSEMMNPSNIQNFNNPTFGNSLGHIVRNNTFLEANEILSNSPVLNAINTNANNNNNEPVYTGL